MTPLSLTVQYSSVYAVKIMLDDYDGDLRQGQLLIYAIRRKYDIVEALELLLDRGTPINETMYENHDWSRRFHFWMPMGTSLHEAAMLGKVKAARYLLTRGIDASIKDTKGFTALDRAREFKHPECVKLLEDVENTTEKSVSGAQSGSDVEETPAPSSSSCSVM